MNALDSFVTNIQRCAEAARDELARNDTLKPHIDTALPIPRPFIGGGPIRLVVLGQDPTVQNAASRAEIRTVLNLDKSGSLRRYIERVAGALGMGLENVYATNVCKHFFRQPPTEIAKEQGLDVLQACGSESLPIVREELARFPEAVVVSLGEPVLSVLVRTEGSRKVRTYWAFEMPRDAMSAISVEDSQVGRKVYPLPHQPSLRKAFYEGNLDHFLAFVRRDSGLPQAPAQR
jgi:uracil-DNA glycosylase